MVKILQPMPKTCPSALVFDRGSGNRVGETGNGNKSSGTSELCRSWNKDSIRLRSTLRSRSEVREHQFPAVSLSAPMVMSGV